MAVQKLLNHFLLAFGLVDCAYVRVFWICLREVLVAPQRE
jgi:hypothetical protein